MLARVGQFHDDADRYLALMRREVPAYDALQDALARQTLGLEVRRVLDLGTGTGVTLRRVLDAHPGARGVGLDASERMLAAARELLPAGDADLAAQRMEDPLPAGPFDLAVSAFCVHHLDGAGKAELFARVAERLRPGGRLVVADVVTPEEHVERPTPIDPAVDHPDTAAEQLGWLEAAGFGNVRRAWAEGDLAVIAGDLASRPHEPWRPPRFAS
jgi:tRNA (cmo5U34)-methyltransferase